MFYNNRRNVLFAQEEHRSFYLVQELGNQGPQAENTRLQGHLRVDGQC